MHLCATQSLSADRATVAWRVAGPLFWPKQGVSSYASLDPALGVLVPRHKPSAGVYAFAAVPHEPFVRVSTAQREGASFNEVAAHGVNWWPLVGLALADDAERRRRVGRAARRPAPAGPAPAAGEDGAADADGLAGGALEVDEDGVLLRWTVRRSTARTRTTARCSRARSRCPCPSSGSGVSTARRGFRPARAARSRRRAACSRARGPSAHQGAARRRRVLPRAGARARVRARELGAQDGRGAAAGVLTACRARPPSRHGRRGRRRGRRGRRRRRGRARRALRRAGRRRAHHRRERARRRRSARTQRRSARARAEKSLRTLRSGQRERARASRARARERARRTHARSRVGSELGFRTTEESGCLLARVPEHVRPLIRAFRFDVTPACHEHTS